MDYKEYLEVLHELFECKLKPSVKCEMCEEDVCNPDIEGISLCVYGKLNEKSLSCIQSILKKHNLKYMRIKGELGKAHKIYTSK